MTKPEPSAMLAVSPPAPSSPVPDVVREVATLQCKWNDARRRESFYETREAAEAMYKHLDRMAAALTLSAANHAAAAKMLNEQVEIGERLEAEVERLRGERDHWHRAYQGYRRDFEAIYKQLGVQDTDDADSGKRLVARLLQLVAAEASLETAYKWIVRQHKEKPVQDWACRQCVGDHVIIPKGYEGPEFVCTPHKALAALPSPPITKIKGEG